MVTNGLGVMDGQVLLHPFIVYVDTVVSLGNALLLVILLYVYLGSYRKIKSSFTLGLILFATLLLVQNILSSSFLLFHQAFRVPEIGAPLFLLNITEFFGLAILLRITWRWRQNFDNTLISFIMGISV